MIGIIAGEGRMAELIIESLLETGSSPFIIGIKGITPPSVLSLSPYSTCFHVTQIGKVITFCKKFGITDITFAGRVQHKTIFNISLLKMDWTTLKLWFGVKDKRADSLLGAIVNAFEKCNIRVMSSIAYLKKHLPEAGLLTQNTPPSRNIIEQMQFGIQIARKIGELDIGQTVVIKKGTIVAVEAMEGTDLCIQRAGDIAGPGCVIVKMAKPKQDLRFDIPVIGLNTIEKLIKIKAAALVIQAGLTLVLDKEAILLAEKHAISIIAIDPDCSKLKTNFSY